MIIWGNADLEKLINTDLRNAIFMLKLSKNGEGAKVYKCLKAAFLKFIGYKLNRDGYFFVDKCFDEKYKNIYEKHYSVYTNILAQYLGADKPYITENIDKSDCEVQKTAILYFDDMTNAQTGAVIFY